ncbi:hypothetical protein [Mycolicibacterium baixiangningiae]|uniref:hypothetical protein n=1 Tax=Mycolicibacterium baixiangningiae TaxID=2761578 RepID=UPI0018D0FF2E|nr:hypothetical protein [Mycolicibacterium baixiangningiae]
MRSLPITAPGRLLCHVHRALDVTAVGRSLVDRYLPEDETTPEDVCIVDRELTRC